MYYWWKQDIHLWTVCIPMNPTLYKIENSIYNNVHCFTVGSFFFSSFFPFTAIFSTRHRCLAGSLVWKKCHFYVILTVCMLFPSHMYDRKLVTLSVLGSQKSIHSYISIFHAFAGPPLGQHCFPKNFGPVLLTYLWTKIWKRNTQKASSSKQIWQKKKSPLQIKQNQQIRITSDFFCFCF